MHKEVRIEEFRVAYLSKKEPVTVSFLTEKEAENKA